MAKVAGKISKTYAKALFEACEPAKLESVRDSLFALASLWQGNKELQDTLQNPALPKGERVNVARDLVKWLKEGDERLSNFLALLVENKRMSALPQIAEEFARSVEILKKSLVLEIVSAFPLDADERGSIENRMREQFGGMVTISWKVDKEIIGGLLVRVGDRLLDSSIRGALNKVAAELNA